MKYKPGDRLYDKISLKEFATIKAISKKGYKVYWYHTMTTLDSSTRSIEDTFYINITNPNDLLKSLL